MSSKCDSIAYLMLLTLSACQGESDKAKASGNPAYRSDPAAAKVDALPRLLTGQDFKDSLVDKNFIFVADGATWSEEFHKNGVYISRSYGDGFQKNTMLYKIYYDEYCLYEIKNSKKPRINENFAFKNYRVKKYYCGNVFHISNEEFRFLKKKIGNAPDYYEKYNYYMKIIVNRKSINSESM